MKKRMISTLLAVLMLLALLPTTVFAETSSNGKTENSTSTAGFADAVGTWYDDAANDLAKRGILAGRSDGSFDGSASITRAEFATILIRALALPQGGSSSFRDVAPTAWYYGAVSAASAQGLVSGYEDGSFRPDASISRQEAMVMLARAAKTLGLDSKGTADLSAFHDADKIDPWALEYVSFHVANGLMVGSDGLLRPQDSISRAETAVSVLRLLQKVELSKVEVQVQEISIQPSEIKALEVGKTQTLTATVLPADAKNKDISWSSSDTAVATVSDAGLVTAVKAGTATIVAKTKNGKQASCSVTVIRTSSGGGGSSDRPTPPIPPSIVDDKGNALTTPTWYPDTASPMSAKIFFATAMDKTALENKDNYSITTVRGRSAGGDTAETAVAAEDGKSVTVTFANALTASSELAIKAMPDAKGTMMPAPSTLFFDDKSAIVTDLTELKTALSKTTIETIFVAADITIPVDDVANTVTIDHKVTLQSYQNAQKTLQGETTTTAPPPELKGVINVTKEGVVFDNLKLECGTYNSGTNDKPTLNPITCIYSTQPLTVKNCEIVAAPATGGAATVTVNFPPSEEDKAFDHNNITANGNSYSGSGRTYLHKNGQQDLVVAATSAVLATSIAYWMQSTGAGTSIELISGTPTTCDLFISPGVKVNVTSTGPVGFQDLVVMPDAEFALGDGTLQIMRLLDITSHEKFTLGNAGKVYYMKPQDPLAPPPSVFPTETCKMTQPKDDTDNNVEDAYWGTDAKVAVYDDGYVLKIKKNAPVGSFYVAHPLGKTVDGYNDKVLQIELTNAFLDADAGTRKLYPAVGENGTVYVTCELVDSITPTP